MTSPPRPPFWNLVHALQGVATLRANRAAADVNNFFLVAWKRAAGGDARAFDVTFWNDVRITIGRSLRAAMADVEGRYSHAIHELVAPVELRKIHGIHDVRRAEAAGAAELKSNALFRPADANDVNNILYQKVGGASWDERLARYGNNSSPIGKIISDGISSGKSTNAIAKEIQPLVDGARYKSVRLARTEIHRVNVETQENSARKFLGHSLAGWRWVATLDKRTCPICGARDGKTWGAGDARPKIPAHPNCRCTWVPITKPIHGLRPTVTAPRERAAKIYPNAPAPRTGVGAPTSAATDYSKWFNAQNAGTQQDILGKKLFQKLGGSPTERVGWTAAIDAFGLRHELSPTTFVSAQEIPSSSDFSSTLENEKREESIVIDRAPETLIEPPNHNFERLRRKRDQPSPRSRDAKSRRRKRRQ